MGAYSSATHLVGPCHVLNVQSVIFKLQFNQFQSQRFAQVFLRPPFFVTGSFLTWAVGAGRGAFPTWPPLQEQSRFLQASVPWGVWEGERAETKVSPDQNCRVLFWLYITVCVIAGQYERKMSFVLSFGFKVWVSLWAKHFSLPPPLSALLQRRRWGLNQESLDFLFGGGVILVYLSGVNFQALSSFWACSSLSLVCSSSAFILRKNKLMAGSTMDDLSWAALGCWTCFRYWIWVCKVKETIRMNLESQHINASEHKWCNAQSVKKGLFSSEASIQGLKPPNQTLTNHNICLIITGTQVFIALCQLL